MSECLRLNIEPHARADKAIHAVMQKLDGVDMPDALRRELHRNIHEIVAWAFGTDNGCYEYSNSDDYDYNSSN